MNRLKGKVVALTGGALGIGAACARRMAQEGALVAIIDLHDEVGRQLADEISSQGGSAHYFHVDVSIERELVIDGGYTCR